MRLERDPPISLPPLLSGLQLEGAADPFLKARAEAALGCDAGLVVHNIAPHWLRAALVLAPDTPLDEAMAALPACEVGFQNALGALAPPEVSVHFEWTGGMRVNGARCGRFRVAASGRDPAEMPDWLVVGFELPLLPDDSDNPGMTPDDTALFMEGCADVRPPALLEAWARHSLVWITGLEDTGGRAALHREWRGLVWNMGEDITDPRRGIFMGVDENFGMLLRDADGETGLVPLGTLLEGT